MISITQLKSDTARANGAKSRGPKSAETRSISSKNAIKHGFTSHNVLLLACENPDELNSMFDDFKAYYAPANSMEMRMVHLMVCAHWRLCRLMSIETALFDYEMARQEPELEKKIVPFDVGIQLAVSFVAMADQSRALSLLSRYESRLHRIHDRTRLILLEMRQTAQAATPQPRPHLVKPERPAPPIFQTRRPKLKIAKRTHHSSPNLRSSP